MSCQIDTIPNRDCPPTILLRRHWREGKRVRKETVANPADHPEWLAEGIRALAGGRRAPGIRRALPHGHAATILGTLESLGFKRVLARGDSCNRRLAPAAIATRAVGPLSKFGTARLLSEDTASSSPGALPGLSDMSGSEVPGMLDRLPERQPGIGRSFANRRRAGEALILYDPRPRPCLPVHARMPCRMAHEGDAGPDPVRRGRPRNRAGARGTEPQRTASEPCPPTSRPPP